MLSWKHKKRCYALRVKMQGPRPVIFAWSPRVCWESVCVVEMREMEPAKHLIEELTHSKCSINGGSSFLPTS